MSAENALEYCKAKEQNKTMNTTPWIPQTEANKFGRNSKPPKCDDVRLDLSADENSRYFYGGKKSRRRSSKKSHRKSSKKQHKSRNARKFRRGRR